MTGEAEARRIEFIRCFFFFGTVTIARVKFVVANICLELGFLFHLVSLHLSIVRGHAPPARLPSVFPNHLEAWKKLLKPAGCYVSTNLAVQVALPVCLCIN